MFYTAVLHSCLLGNKLSSLILKHNKRNCTLSENIGASFYWLFFNSCAANTIFVLQMHAHCCRAWASKSPQGKIACAYTGEQSLHKRTIAYLFKLPKQNWWMFTGEIRFIRLGQAACSHPRSTVNSSSFTGIIWMQNGE